MYQVDWQEYSDVQEFSSEQYKDFEEALNCYKDKAARFYWAKLSTELLKNVNRDSETYKEAEENWQDNNGDEKQHVALENSFGVNKGDVIKVTKPYDGCPRGRIILVTNIRDDGSIMGFHYKNNDDWTRYLIYKGDYELVSEDELQL